jgi:uncharacterized membrane protein YcfT
LFFDVYPFFPFFIVVAAAMLVAKLFIESQNRDRVIKLGFGLGATLCLSGFLLLNALSDNIWLSLANAEFKLPPHLGYMLFYIGEVFIVISLVAITMTRLPKFIQDVLSLIGRNTLVSYVVHYSFFAAVPLAAAIGGGALYEAIFFIFFFVFSYLGIKKWDSHKTIKKAKGP